MKSSVASAGQLFPLRKIAHLLMKGVRCPPDNLEEAAKPKKKKKKKAGAMSAKNLASSKELAERRLNNRKIKVRQDAVKHGRIAIMVIAIINIGWTAVQWISMNNMLAKVEANPGMYVVDHGILAEQKMILIGSFVVGFLFLGLFFWAKKNPFSACLTALILFVSLQVLAAVINPANIVAGIIIKIFIVLALVKAISKAVELRNLEAENNIK